VLIGVVLLALVPARASANPRNPSDGEINRAKQHKSEQAARVGDLQAQVAQAEGDIARLQSDAEAAAEKYNKAVVDYQNAKQKAAEAKDAAKKARKQVDSATQDLGEFARGSYMMGSTYSASYALLTAHGPSDFIERSGLLQVAGQKRLDVLSHYQVATVGRANADSKARSAVEAMTQAKAAAATAKQQAESKVADARTQEKQLEAQKEQVEGELVKAKAALSGLLTERQAYNKWKAHQEELARERARRAAEARARAEALARQQAAERAAAERAAAERAAAEQAAAEQAAAEQRAAEEAAADQPAPPPAAPPAPPAAPPAPPVSSNGGQVAVNAAMQWLGTPYAWAGGTPSGPSYGTYPDEGVLGFDCSGLALYAWAQAGISLPHYSGYQYSSGQHPSMDALQPGDLLFWSYDGTPSSIHHVAIYIGNGEVIQAPQSGDVVKISPIWYDGLVGATRPGT
jgi:cell wall-associated NlpC family hydrolase